MARASTETLEHTGPAEKERMASEPQRAVGKYARAAFAKRKKNILVCPKHQIVTWESQDEQEREGSEQEHGEEKVDFTVKEDRFQGREGGQAKRPSLGEEGSMSR